MKKIKGVIVAILIALTYIFLSNNGLLVLDEDLIGKIKSRTLYTTSVIKHNNTITIASFNIQTFGKTKRGKSDVLDVLANITCEFDILAIQELRDNTETTMEYFTNRTNNFCEREFVMSERLGRSRSKENYAFIYNPNKINFISEWTYEEKDDEFEREPYAAAFKAGKFEFVLVNIHTKPDKARDEIEYLSKIMNDFQNQFKEKKIIVLGDLNADCTYFDEKDIDSYFEEYKWIIPNSADTTVKTTKCTYDRIIASKEATEYYNQEKGVYNFDKVFNFKQDYAIQVSDHYPVWANFKIK